MITIMASTPYLHFTPWAWTTRTMYYKGEFMKTTITRLATANGSRVSIHGWPYKIYHI